MEQANNLYDKKISRPKPTYICDTNLELNLIKEPIINKIITSAINNLLYYFEDRYNNINEIDMTNNCTAMALWIKEICEVLNIKCETYTIYPGFDKDAKLYNNQGFHYFNVIEIEEKEYLIDLSYKQFFKSRINKSDIPLAGEYMINNKERLKVAEEILKKGYILINNNVLKHYCDGFALSYRNDLYYQIFGYLYETPYTDSDYMNFLNGIDSQVNHESLKYLRKKQ